ncbi:hypothetical protein theurythT_03880 [Thalassotalea eurytherma]|uniref:Uncharacterized protein n=1 Tax=Thalassotalea eurytherma TaxID=1144278 RepID=A0ABQ6GYB7_9GAMM|nr:hypothetical protein theurythT_03880 [Thalassotalea eurytherma]
MGYSKFILPIMFCAEHSVHVKSIYTKPKKFTHLDFSGLLPSCLLNRICCSCEVIGLNYFALPIKAIVKIFKEA